MNLVAVTLWLALTLYGCDGGPSAAAPKPHSVTLHWVASVTPPPFVGYYVYRAKQGSAYSRLTPSPVLGTNYLDGTVAKKTTYLYYVTAVASGGVESARSNTFTAVIPNP